MTTRFDLDDPQALLYCRTCGAPYLSTPAACSTCRGSAFIDRAEAARVAEEARAAESAPEESFEPDVDDAPHEPDSLALTVPLVDTSDPNEDLLISSALENAGIPFLRHESPHALGLNVGGWGTVRYSVHEDDVARAGEVLDRVESDLRAAMSGDNLDRSAPGTNGSLALDPTDDGDADMEEARRARHASFARTFMVIYGLFSGLVLLAAPLEGAALPGAKAGLVTLAALVLACAAWSCWDPRRGFGTGLITMAVVAIGALVLGGVVVSGMGFVALVAVWAAWNRARTSAPPR